MPGRQVPFNREHQFGHLSDGDPKMMPFMYYSYAFEHQLVSYTFLAEMVDIVYVPRWNTVA